ncbi:TFIID-18kDa-domain-containing protein [Laetiporus sulphureus 93-53]|uniref:Transcription initiation factor TFIID subunit 13 n=1 Tax=Laetiporus sulphureus 93-53 TaxID=1314785 RepID=A0A165FUT8_9APHY|nr:TFIID-18kDa-domain-containing protein [Laetiporus sulphureus 93-53]KZT09440.1 TFIID-18kDa-domain-containing protein [Laetiporus sulphureus 93-53]
MSYYPSQSGTTYPYSSYGNYPQTAGAYPYQTAYPPTAVAGYGATWPYPYSYYPQHQQAQQPGASTAPKPAVPSTSTAAAPALTNVAATQRQRPAPTTYTFTPSYTPISAAAGTSGRSGRKQPTFKGLFSKELRNLMYGFGDDRNPANDTVNVMEEILVEYIVDVCQTASASGKGKTRLSIEELRRALSRPADAKKLARMEELLFMQEDIKRARAEFDESEVPQGGSFQT